MCCPFFYITTKIKIPVTSDLNQMYTSLVSTEIPILETGFGSVLLFGLYTENPTIPWYCRMIGLQTKKHII